MNKEMLQKETSRREYTKPELTKLGSYIELTQVDGTQPQIDGGPPYTAGRVS